MKTYAYDIECLKNLFTLTAINVDDESDELVFYIGLDKEEYGDIKKFLRERMILVGYNNNNYDNCMLRFLMHYKGNDIINDLHFLSGKLVDDNYRNDKDIMALRYPRETATNWKSVDLMSILAFDKLMISLKQTAINLKWSKIQDMPIHHDSLITDESQLEMVLSYNKNDVLITKELYHAITPLRNLRTDLSELYHLDLSSASDSRMANLLLAKIYSEELKVDIRNIRDLRTHRDMVLLGDCIAKFVEFKSPEMKGMLERISSTIVYSHKNYKYSENLYFAGCNFALGVGGIHTVDAPGIFESDNKYLLQDMDVASYYPNLIINNNFYPEHLGIGFIEVLKKITEERIHAKKIGDKVKADGLKITANSIFGKMGCETFWLLDPKQMLSTTVSGQLGLLMLIEDLYLNGITVISANTDGVVCKIPRELENKYYEIAKNWEKTTSLELEYTPYKKYVRRDVNSYITIKEDGHTKEKGAFLKEVDLKKAYHMPIVAKALYAYYANDIPIKQTLEECKDIMEFCISQKSGGNFGIELQTIKNTEKLQKTNRFFISNKGGSLVKREMYSNKTIGLYVGKLVKILNDFNPSFSFAEYDVDFAFYEKEIMKIIDEIEPKQMELFDLSSLGQSKIIIQEVPKTVNKDISKTNELEEITIKELNKLGKNQFAKKIASLVDNREKIKELSTRYLYVESFDASTLTANVYCLAKGVGESIYIDKNLYNRVKISNNQLIYCNKFSKINDQYYIMDCSVVEKLEVIKKQML